MDGWANTWIDALLILMKFENNHKAKAMKEEDIEVI